MCEQFFFHRFGSVVYCLRQFDSNTPFCKSMSEADNVNNYHVSYVYHVYVVLNLLLSANFGNMPVIHYV